MNRRHAVGVGVAVAAAAGGLGWSLWRTTRPANVPAALWTQRFMRPEGGELALADFRGRPLVVNFWATWCPPCVKEMPELDRFQREFGPRGWQVVGLAIDGPTPVREFLQRVPVTFPIGLAGFGGTELGRDLGNTTGGLPFTVLIGRDGAVAHRKLGETSHAELARWAAKLG